MILFYHVGEDIKYTPDNGIEQVLSKVTDVNKISFDNVYFTTPSDFQKQMAVIKSHMPDADLDKVIFVADPKDVTKRPEFPEHIGFMKFEDVLEKLKGKKEVKVAIVNAMSTAFGDHLIGMRAYEYWYEKMCQHFDKVTVRLFQFDPYKHMTITLQYQEKFDNLLVLPSTLGALVQHDAYIDLGSMLTRENFDNRPMIDFFLESLSIDPQEVPAERKRMKYSVNPETDAQIEDVFQKIRTKKRPILLFHRTSTTPIREMSQVAAKRLVREIIQNSGYYVISAVPLEFQHPRFLDISRYSASVDHFASIISKVDGIVTVDTSTYHFADAFNTPTVALFTTIEPEYRIKYYPYVEGIMLEEKGGWMYGRHKHAAETDIAKQEIDYIENKWASLDVHRVLKALDRAKSKVL